MTPKFILKFGSPFEQIWSKKKNQNCQFQLKLVLSLIRIGRIQCWFSLLFCFRLQIFFLSKFDQKKNERCQFKLKLFTETHSSMQNSIEIPFLDKLGPRNLFYPKIQNCLNWNLVPGLIQTCRIQWWCSFYLFKTGNTLF